MSIAKLEKNTTPEIKIDEEYLKNLSAEEREMFNELEDPDSDNKQAHFINEDKEDLVLALIFHDEESAAAVHGSIYYNNFISPKHKRTFKAWHNLYAVNKKIPTAKQIKLHLVEGGMKPADALVLEGYVRQLAFHAELAVNSKPQLIESIRTVAARQKMIVDAQSMASAITAGDLSSAGEYAAKIAETATGSAAPFGEIAELADHQAPPFPVEALKVCPVFMNQVAEVAHKLQIAADVPATIGLSVIGAAIAKNVQIEVYTGYTEHICIWTGVGLPPGERKSPALEQMRSPLSDWEKSNAENTELDLRIRKGERSIAPSRKKEIEASLKTAEPGSPEYRAKLGELGAIEMLLKSPEPEALRLLINDATPEAVADFLTAHEFKAAVIADESAFLEVCLGRYSGGSCPNLEMYLQAWSGKGSPIDRANGRIKLLPEAFLTIGLCVQPEPLQKMYKNEEASGKGFPARFLACLPKSRLGNRDVISEGFNQSITDGWNNLITNLLNERKNRYFTFSDDAQKRLQQIAKDIEPRLHPKTGDLSGIAAWVAKAYPGQLSRVAAVLHVASGEESNIVTLDTLEAAFQIIEYFTHQTKLIANIGSQDASYKIACTILDRLKQSKETKFKRSKFRKEIWEIRKNDDEILSAAYQRLVDANIIKVQAYSKEGVPRSYQVNPIISNC